VKNTIIDSYSYRIAWSGEDNEYVGLRTEFPSLSWLAKTQEEALQRIKEIVADVSKDMKIT